MGCCQCCRTLERERKKEPPLCIELNHHQHIVQSSKPLSVIQKLHKDYSHDDTNTNNKDNKPNDYKLNDLRSLEGVARLWSKKLSDNKLSFLHKSKSMPINDNMYTSTNELSPISISTYFFQHTPPNQSNLLRSHSDHMAREIILSQQKQYHQLSETAQIEKPHNGNNVNQHYNNKAAHKFSSLSASNLKAQSFMKHLPPLISDDEENEEFEIEMEIEIENLPENEFEFETEFESDIFSVFCETDMNLTLDAGDFVQHSSRSGKSKNIGVGASGIVTKAFHFASCQMLAIKHCRSAKKSKVLAFRKEANIYKQFVDNKYIVDIIGIGRGEKNNEFIMGLEFMDLNSCQSLHIETIQDMHSRECVVGYIAFNVLQALQELHGHLYVHNDVKPGNILVNKYGEVKLSDFDTVLQLQNVDAFLTQNNGTQKFQPPEKLIFSPCYSTNCDIWSLGITCFELLFGGRHFETEHDAVSYTTNPPRMDAENCGLSANCCDFINQCLTVDRRQRPEAKQLLQHLWLEHIANVALKEKWPWLVDVEHKINICHEELLFMINSLIVHYSRRKFSAVESESAAFPTLDSFNGQHSSYSDEERIENMAKYAYCTKDTVIDRIRVTVSYIKSQLKKMDN